MRRLLPLSALCSLLACGSAGSSDPAGGRLDSGDGGGEAGGVDWFADVDGDSYGDAAAAVRAGERPEGHVAEAGDCDDRAAEIHPGAPEVCNGVDDDCDGTPDDGAEGADTWYPDVDQDGHGNPIGAVDACESLDGYAAVGDDCDDADDGAYPGALEVCDGIDNDCDAEVDEADPATSPEWHPDADGDGYGDGTITVCGCTPPDGYVGDNSDCDDSHAAAHPGASEICDDLDNDCDGVINSPAPADVTTWYRDGDHDGYGDASVSTVGCECPDGYVSDGTDCDDRNGAVNPGAPEVCDGIDDDCDGDEAADCGADTGGASPTGECDGVNMGGTAARAFMNPAGIRAAMAYTPAVDLTLGRIELWTGGKLGASTVSVWSDDAVYHQPSASLASGSWKMTRPDGWQGADLDACVTLTAGTTYWIVWAPVVGAQSSLDVGGTPVEYRGSYDGGASWNGPSLEFAKYRLYCCE